MCTRYPIINRVSELKVHIELTRFVQPEKIEIDANERAVNEKSQYCFFVCTTFDSFLNDLYVPPTTEEQEAIAGILFDMDLDIYKLEEKLSKYQKIMQGMMEELLTGKVRLV